MRLNRLFFYDRLFLNNGLLIACAADDLQEARRSGRLSRDGSIRFNAKGRESHCRFLRNGRGFSGNGQRRDTEAMHPLPLQKRETTGITPIIGFKHLPGEGVLTG